MPTFSNEGVELYYEVHGQGSPLVFAHGVGGNHACWYQQVCYFSRFYRVVTFDHRGFGNSRVDSEGPGRSAFVKDLRGLLDHLELPQTSLVAQSMGGGTCLGFTVRYPERVRALIMADTTGNINDPGPFNDRVTANREKTDNLSQLERVLAPGFDERDPAMAEMYLQINSFNVADRFNMRGQVEPVTREQLDKLKMPVLFLVGEEDALVPLDVVRMAHQMVPGSSLMEVTDAGHSVYFEQPEVFNHVIHDFLRTAGVA